jgi:hypothetical protein
MRLAGVNTYQAFNITGTAAFNIAGIAAHSLACGKPAFLRCFRRLTQKKTRFPAYFAVFSLRSQKALAIVPSGPDFRCEPRGESAAGLEHFEARKNSGG